MAMMNCLNAKMLIYYDVLSKSISIVNTCLVSLEFCGGLIFGGIDADALSGDVPPSTLHHLIEEQALGLCTIRYTLCMFHPAKEKRLQMRVFFSPAASP